MVTIYIHIGQAKTGTTALQHFLGNNHALLKEKGFLYPKSVMYKDKKNHHPLVWSLWTSPRPSFVDIDKPSDYYYSKLFREIESSGCANAILSSEMFEVRREPEFLNSLKNYLCKYKIAIIVYVRRQDHAIQAHYNTNIKTYPFYTGTIYEYMDAYSDMLDSYELINAWAKIFGKENIIVRVYEKEQINNDIIYDFMDIFKINITNKYSMKIKNKQLSISRDTLEFLRIINSLDLCDKEHQRINLAIRSKMQLFDEKYMLKVHNLLSLSERNIFLKRYTHCNQQIAKNYLNRNNGKLYLSEPQAKNVNIKKYSGIQPENIIKMFQVFFSYSSKKEDECICKIKEYVLNHDNEYYYGDNDDIDKLEKILYQITKSIHRKIIRYFHNLYNSIVNIWA